MKDALVWAISADGAWKYYTPRDCPRACFWPGPDTTDEDRERLYAGVEAHAVMCIEAGWLERVRSTTLYRYTMPPETFAQTDAAASHYVSRVTVLPLSVEPVGDLLAAIAAAGVELRVTPRLGPLWSLVRHSSMEFSGTRLRNAVGWPEEFE
jgi:hypothetical protein